MDKWVKVNKIKDVQEEEEEEKFKKAHHFTVIKPFQPGRDNNYAIYPVSVMISCLLSQYDTVLIYCPLLHADILHHEQRACCFAHLYPPSSTDHDTGFIVIINSTKNFKTPEHFGIKSIAFWEQFKSLCLFYQLFVYSHLCPSRENRFGIVPGQIEYSLSYFCLVGDSLPVQTAAAFPVPFTMLYSWCFTMLSFCVSSLHCVTSY